MSNPVLFMMLTLLSLSCMRVNSDSGAERDQEASNSTGQKAITPDSHIHFAAAEQQLAEGRYIFAATQLDKGIVAFRIETGKMIGAHAIRANHTIDALTKLRKTLRRGDAVDTDALHQAILSAMAFETTPSAPLPKPIHDIMVPVNGN